MTGQQPSTDGKRHRSMVIVLAGGTGGAKLARGMLDVVGPAKLAVIANTGDDIEIYGAHVSPDPDLITFWLADRIDERGWGLSGDTFEVMDALRALGRDVWFALGDRDLAWCLERRRLVVDEGLSPTGALRILAGRIGVDAQVLPVCDEPLRTHVNGMPLQQFLIRARGQGPVRGVELRDEDGALLASGLTAGALTAGALTAGAHATPAQADATPRASAEVRQALAQARAVVIGPSNPVISIWPILAVLGEELRATPGPVVAVSPVVGGEIVKGPTEAFMSALGMPTTAGGVAAYYETISPGMLDGMVADEALGAPGPARLATLQADTRMSDAASRARVAGEVLAFAESLAGN